MPTPKPLPSVGSRWRWVARPERPDIIVMENTVSWAGHAVIRIQYHPDDPQTKTAWFKGSPWVVTPEDFHARFTPASETTNA